MLFNVYPEIFKFVQRPKNMYLEACLMREPSLGRADFTLSLVNHAHAVMSWS